MSDCIIWKGAVNNKGYGHLYVKNEYWLAHRFSFYKANGYRPNICRHTCDNRRCINPEHLLDGTMIDNMKDAKSRKRAIGRPKGWSPRRDGLKF